MSTKGKGTSLKTSKPDAVETPTKKENSGVKFLREWLAPILTVAFIFAAGKYYSKIDDRFEKIEESSKEIAYSLKHETEMRKEYYQYIFNDQKDSSSPRFHQNQYYNFNKDSWEYSPKK